MPTHIGKRTIAETREHLRRREWAREMGVDVGANDASLPRFRARERLRLEPVGIEPTAIFALPGSGYIVVAHARLTVLASQVLATRHEMRASWDDFLMELDGPQHLPSYPDVVADYYPEPMTILNPWLTGGHRLDRCQREGLIIARGQRSVPPEFAEHSVLNIELSLWDENGEELRFDFRGRLNHKLLILHDRRLKKQCPHSQPRQPIFNRDGATRNNDEKGLTQTKGSRLRLAARDEL